MSKCIVALVSAIAFAVFAVTPAIRPAAQTGADDPPRPRQHFELRNPANLTAAESLMIYREIGERMAARYAVSREPVVAGFRKWKRLNASPYKSETHGRRYVNNYANATAAPLYAAPAPGMRMPAGSVLAKDSFTVTSEGAVYPGALFVMEKRAAGTSPETGDWRYLMIMPDGSYLGDSLGDNAPSVGFCHDCHGKQSDTDSLFGVPEEYRIP